MGNPIVEKRRSYDRLISTMGFPILVRQHLYIESGPRSTWARYRSKANVSDRSLIGVNPRVFAFWVASPWDKMDSPHKGPVMQQAFPCHDVMILATQIAKFMGPTWGPPGSCRPQMGPMLAPWTLLSGLLQIWSVISSPIEGANKQGEKNFLFDHCNLLNCKRSCGKDSPNQHSWWKLIEIVSKTCLFYSPVKPRSHCADLEAPISTIWKIVENGMVGSGSHSNVVLTSWKSTRSGKDRQWSGSQYDKVLL